MSYTPSLRLLMVLELLQSHEMMSGPELAERLEVNVRTVRRYITMLRDMGLPVEQESGRTGGYYLMPGFRLPPLMFDDDEILAVMLGLMTARHIGLASAEGAENAVRKIERVLPERLLQQVQAVRAALTFDMRPTSQRSSASLIMQFSYAAHARRQLWLCYRSHEQTERTVDVYGLVVHADNLYAVSYCHLRAAMRTFRLDRVVEAHLLETVFEMPPDFDARAFLLESIAKQPGMWLVEVFIEATLEQAQDKIAGDVALLETAKGGVQMHCYTDNLRWMSHYLISLDLPFEVQHPPALRDELHRLAREILSR